jgi:hypothetical protein
VSVEELWWAVVVCRMPRALSGDSTCSHCSRADPPIKYYTNTCFDPSSTNSQERQKYTILLIVTDGMINDMDATKVQITWWLCRTCAVRILLPARHALLG